MQTLDPAYLAAAKSLGRYPNVIVNINGFGDISGTDAIVEVHVVKGDTAKPEYFDTMLALSGECKILIDRRKISNEELITSGKKLQVFSAFNDLSGTEIGRALLGTFYITQYDTTNEKIGTIKASDAMLYTGVDYNPELVTYPITLSDMLVSAFQQSGISLSAVTLDIDPHVQIAPYKADDPVAEDMNGAPYTCREVISRIAAMNLGAIYINNSGNPQIVSYTQVAPEINSNNIIAFQRSTETFFIDQVRVFKSEERMQKKRTSYLKLAYAPRFDNMDEIGSGSAWFNQVALKSRIITDKPWTSSVLQMQGVGEIEIGDIIQVLETPLLVTGIIYDFVDAHFTETLYSFAWTEEEYLMTHPPLFNAAGVARVAQQITSVTDPAESSSGRKVKINDMWYRVSDMNSKEIQEVKKRVHDADTASDKWETVYTAPATSGGVGEAVGKYSETFNVYKTEQKSALSVTRNQIDDGTINDYYGGNKADGSGITLYHDLFSHGGGQNVKVSDSQFVEAYGYNIEVQGHSSFVFGNTIKIKRFTQQWTAQSSILCGQSIFNFEDPSDTVGGYISYSAVLGTAINILSSLTRSIVTGNSITITSADCCSISGIGHNIVNALYCIIGGYGADVDDASLRLVLGNNGNIFTVDSVGDVKTAGSYGTMGADYAEMFEWADGNPENEDRRGMLVTLSGDKIIPAHGDDFVGIISGNPSVIGNNPMHWHGKYKTDVFGSVIYDDNGDAELSEEYDPKREYIPRSERPEWAAVGLTGRLVVVDDGSCVPGQYISARQGSATKCYSRKNARVLRRIDSNHIEVLFGR